MFEQAQQECDLVLFNNLVYLAEQQGHANPSAWVVDKLCSLDVETTTARQEDNSLTLIRSKGYTQEIHNQILAELDPQMTPEAMAEAFHILVVNAASWGHSKQWVIDMLTEVGATVVNDEEIDLTAEHILAVENLIDPPVDAEVSDDELQVLYKALEARAELIGLDAEVLSSKHGEINPDYELTSEVIAELTRQVDEFESMFGSTVSVKEEAKKPVETVAETPAETATTADNNANGATISTGDQDPKQQTTQTETDVISTGSADIVADNAPLPTDGAVAPESVKKRGRKSKSFDLVRVKRIIADLLKIAQEVEALEGGDDA